MASSSSGQGQAGAAAGFVSILGPPYPGSMGYARSCETLYQFEGMAVKESSWPCPIFAQRFFPFFLERAVLVYAEASAAGIRGVTKAPRECRRPRMACSFFSRFASRTFSYRFVQEENPWTSSLP